MAFTQPPAVVFRGRRAALNSTPTSCTCRRYTQRRDANVATQMKAVKKKSGGRKDANKADEKLSIKGFGGVKRQEVGESGLRLSRDGDIDAFCRWLRANGASIARVAIGTRDGRRGVFALESIDAGQTILTVPTTATIRLGKNVTDPTEAATTLLKIMREDKHKMQKEHIIASVLPHDECTSALFYSDEELSALDDEAVAGECRERIEEVNRRYEKIVEASDLPNLDKNELLWATHMVVSRVLGLQTEDDVFERIMMPFLDMCNHSSDAYHDLKHRDGQYVVVARRRLAAGDEVCIQYGDGQLSNARLLMDYGFIEPHNPNDLRTMVGGDLRKLRPDGIPKLVSFLQERLDLARYSDEDDEHDLADVGQDARSQRKRVAAQFRKERKWAMRRTIELLQGRRAETP